MAEEIRETAQQTAENQIASFTSEAYDHGEPVADPKPPKKEEAAPKEEQPAPPKEEVVKVEAVAVANDEQAHEEDAAGESKKKQSAQERINEITRARREAERRAVTAEGQIGELATRLAELEKKLSNSEQLKDVKKAGTVDEIDPQEPKPDDFDYGELDSRYIKALANYQADKRFNELRADDDKRRVDRETAQRQEKAREQFEVMIDNGAQKYEDFFEKVVEGAETGLWPLSAELGELALASDVGDEVLYHMASNPEEAIRVFRSSPVEQARIFGRLEAKFSAARTAASGEADETAEKNTGKPAAKIPKAPQPVESARGAGGKFTASADSDDFAAFEQRATSGS